MQKKEKGQHFLGKSATIEGKLICQGHIRIDGNFRGEISVDGTLAVGEDAMMHAEIHATVVSIAGEIHGSIIADQVIEILPSGKVFGEIQAPKLMMDEGAIYEGQCRMGRPEEESEEKSKDFGMKEFEDKELLYEHPGKSQEESVAGANM